MASGCILEASDLGKRYRIAPGRARSNMLREELADRARALFRLASRPEPADFWALRDVSFALKPGEVLGVIGRNGAGKTTLLRILARITAPSAGEARLYGRVGSLLDVGTGFHSELTGRENIFLGGAVLGMTRTETARKFDEIVAFAELEAFLDMPLKRYSAGMQVRLAFAVAAHLEPEILLADEVLAVGDHAFQAKCLGKMSEVARGGRTVIFVSHSMAAVSKLCGRVLVLDGGRVAALDSADTAIQSYYRLLQLTCEGTADGSHVLYAEAVPDDSNFAVTRVELLDENRRPMPVVATWDDVVVRVWYRCRVPLRRAAVEFEVSGVDGSTLLLLSTQPDSTVPVEFRVGEHYADCHLRQLPLAAGRYSLGAALAIPQMEYLWRRRHLASFTVVPRDVYGSGQAPQVTRALLAVQHEWSLGGESTARQVHSGEAGEQDAGT